MAARTRGTPQGGVISPLLANLFLHYTFDLSMTRNYPDLPGVGMQTMGWSTAGTSKKRRASGAAGACHPAKHGGLQRISPSCRSW